MSAAEYAALKAHFGIDCFEADHYYPAWYVDGLLANVKEG